MGCLAVDKYGMEAPIEVLPAARVDAARMRRALIGRLYAQGVDVPVLADIFGRSRPTIYRELSLLDAETARRLADDV